MPAARGKSKSKVSSDCSSFRKVLVPCRKPCLSLLPHGDTAKTWSLVSFHHLRGWEREQGAPLLFSQCAPDLSAIQSASPGALPVFPPQREDQRHRDFSRWT